jgi:sterol desaturase/sphingolipid hydroxylase (fatty acid hydroxylase superfamily)
MADVLDGKGPFKEQMQQFVEELGLKESSEEILGPFSDITNRIAEALWNAVFPGATTTLWWPMLALTALITIAFWFFRKGRGAKDADGRERPMGLLEYLVPKKIYTHQSARVDIWLYLLDRGMMPVWFVLFLGSVAPFVERSTIGVLESAFGASPDVVPTVGWRLIYGLVTILIADMIFFFTHYMMHKTQIGWAIHKVHHSAQVLTPLTRPREHFIAGWIWALGPAIGLSLSGGIFAWVFNGNITQVTVINPRVLPLPALARALVTESGYASHASQLSRETLGLQPGTGNEHLGPDVRHLVYRRQIRGDAMGPRAKRSGGIHDLVG